MSKLHKIFCTGSYLCMWLNPPLMMLQYLCTFCFVDDVVFSHNGPNTDTGLESAT